MLPRKLKQVLRREFWSSFQNLLIQGTEVGGLSASTPSCVLGSHGVLVVRPAGRAGPTGDPAPTHSPQLLEEGREQQAGLAVALGLGHLLSFSVPVLSESGAAPPSHTHCCPETPQGLCLPGQGGAGTPPQAPQTVAREATCSGPHSSLNLSVTPRAVRAPTFTPAMGPESPVPGPLSVGLCGRPRGLRAHGLCVNPTRA